jgi:hypothetical protein
MSNTPVVERRKRRRSEKAQIEIQVRYQLRTGDTCVIPARLIDLHETGCGLEVSTPLQTGARVLIFGDMLSRGSGMEIQISGQIAWCRQKAASTYRAGVAFAEALIPQTSTTTTRQQQSRPPEADYYEVLELSPNASTETIRRVYRLLAEDCHPRNPSSGDPARFQAINEAFRVLGNDQQRRSYDERRKVLGGVTASILNLSRAMSELESERGRQQAILLLLLHKRRRSPRQPSLSLTDVEGALGLSHDQLEFAIWYLRERGLVQRADDGRFTITISGVDHLEMAAGRDTSPVKT